MNRQQRRAEEARKRRDQRAMDAHRRAERAAGQENKLPMIGLVALAMILFYAVLVILAATPPAKAHGWYDPSCCSTKDCAPVPTGTVLSTREGWLIVIPPPYGHPMVGASGFQELVPYDGHGIKESLDSNFHVCIGPSSAGPRYLCLYVPKGAEGV